jgi:glycosyltransferase involved in cell wall biosynthesis
MIPLRDEAISDRSIVIESPPRPVEREAQFSTGVFLMIQTLETGGSERQFAALAKSLSSGDFRPELGCIRRRGNFLSELGNIPQFPLAGSLYGLQSVKSRLSLARHLARTRVAISHSFDFYSNLTAIPAARIAGVPVVIGSQRQLGDQLKAAQSRAQMTTFRWCDHVICNSEAAAQGLLQQGLPAHRIAVIANGLPPESFASADPALPRCPGLLRVGMIARMNARYKNHDQFLLAAAALRNQFPDVEFVLVGDGPLRAKLERSARALGIAKQVVFLGDRRDIPAVLASLDISVLPSASESLSNVIMESMAAGLSVVAYQVGGNPELLTTRTGRLVPPNNVAALANAIGQLLSNAQERRELGSNARRHAQANFTIDGMRSRHEELYRELLARKHWTPKARVVPSLPRKIRVAIVAASARYVGGQSVQAELLLRNWRHDRNVAAEFIPIDPPFGFGLRWVERIPFLRTLVRQPLYLWSLWRGLKQADVVHIFSASYWAFLIATVPAWMVARLKGKRTLIHYHSGEARDHLRRFRSTRHLIARMGPMIVPSGYLVEVFHEFGLPAQPVANIVDLRNFSYRERNDLRPRFVCTRGFHPYYGIDVVVRAFAEIKKNFADAQLELVGGGRQENGIRELVRELDLPDVSFSGIVAHHQINECLSRADIFINASCLDNMPVSILEAFAAGTPVVSTSPEGMGYLIEHERTGLLSDVGDFRALAGNAIRLLQEPGLASGLASNAHGDLRRYSWSAVREEWLKIYRALSVESPERLF